MRHFRPKLLGVIFGVVAAVGFASETAAQNSGELGCLSYENDSGNRRSAHNWKISNTCDEIVVVVTWPDGERAGLFNAQMKELCAGCEAEFSAEGEKPLRIEGCGKAGWDEGGCGIFGMQ
jgi:hypothetical protein